MFSLVNLRDGERKASKSQYYSPRMMISAALPPRNAPLGGNRGAMSIQGQGDDRSPFNIETDDPSCISFSENIDESPNRKRHFKYDKSGAI